MSVVLFARAMSTRIGSPRAKLILVYLADCANGYGVGAVPSARKLALIAECGEDDAMAAMFHLRNAGFISLSADHAAFRIDADRLQGARLPSP